MNFWIFQAVPERYDLRDERIIQKGKKDTWYATRYRGRMAVGDFVFFWLGGPPEIRGIYGGGKLISTPYQRPEWESYGVDVEYEMRVAPHLSVSEIREVGALENLLILRAAAGTNFLLTEDEGSTLRELVASRQDYGEA